MGSKSKLSSMKTTSVPVWEKDPEKDKAVKQVRNNGALFKSEMKMILQITICVKVLSPSWYYMGAEKEDREGTKYCGKTCYQEQYIWPCHPSLTWTTLAANRTPLIIQDPPFNKHISEKKGLGLPQTSLYVLWLNANSILLTVTGLTSSGVSTN